MMFFGTKLQQQHSKRNKRPTVSLTKIRIDHNDFTFLVKIHQQIYKTIRYHQSRYVRYYTNTQPTKRVQTKQNSTSISITNELCWWNEWFDWWVESRCLNDRRSSRVAAYRIGGAAHNTNVHILQYQLICSIIYINIYYLVGNKLRLLIIDYRCTAHNPRNVYSLSFLLGINLIMFQLVVRYCVCMSMFVVVEQ